MNSESAGAPGCATCGAALRNDALFCARCGTRISAVEQEPQAGIEPTGPSVNRWEELRVVGWLYGLLLATSLFFGIAYLVDRNGDYDPWFTLVAGIVILAFAVRYKSEILPLLHPSTFGSDALKKLAIAAVIQFALLGTVFYLLEQTGIPFERITDEIQRHHYTLWKLFALYSL